MAQELRKPARRREDRVALALALFRSLPAREVRAVMLEAKARLAHMGPQAREVRNRISGRQSDGPEEWVACLGSLADEVLWAETEGAVEAREVLSDVLRSAIEVSNLETEALIRVAIDVARRAGDEAAVEAREAELTAFQATTESYRTLVADTQDTIGMLQAEHLDSKTRRKFGTGTTIRDLLHLFLPVRPRSARDRALDRLARGMPWRWYLRERKAWQLAQSEGEVRPRSVVKHHFAQIGLFQAARDIQLTAEILNYHLPELVFTEAVAAARNNFESDLRPQKETGVQLDEGRVSTPDGSQDNPLERLVQQQEEERIERGLSGILLAAEPALLRSIAASARELNISLDQIERVPEAATTKDLSLIRLLAKGCTVAAAARELNMEPNAAYQSLHRLRKRVVK